MVITMYSEWAVEQLYEPKTTFGVGNHNADEPKCNSVVLFYMHPSLLHIAIS